MGKYPRLLPCGVSSHNSSPDDEYNSIDLRTAVVRNYADPSSLPWPKKVVAWRVDNTCDDVGEDSAYSKQYMSQS